MLPKPLLSAALVLSLMPALASADAPGPALAAFLDPDAFETIEISPDGAHFAAAVPLQDRTALVFLRASDMTRTGVVSFEKEAYVSSMEWVNPRQLVYTVATRRGSLALPLENGHLYIVNADGSDPRPVNRGVPMVLRDGLLDDDDHILVSANAGSRGDDVARVDLRTGRVTGSGVSSPLTGEQLYPDNAGEVRLATGYIAHELKPRLYLRADGEWEPINIEGASGQAMYVAGFSADNRTAYLMVEEAKGTDGFYALDLGTRERTLLFRDDRVDAYGVLRSPIDGGVIAVRYFDGTHKLRYVVPDDPFARELRKLERAFPGAMVMPTSFTAGGGKGVYRVSSDVNSGDFYLVDHASGKAHFIAASNEALDPAAMVPMRAFRFKARDGLELEGFLTVPSSRAAGEGGPLVVMPHGGPKGVFDRWGFDREVQMLASRGYAVLQVNFRGSGNYGASFRNLGDGQWGRKMQDDLTDATRWAIAEGVATPGRICLYGASYGAYASMMGLVREPGLYACGIGNVGIYDLPKVFREEATNNRYASVTLTEMMGRGDLGEISPNRLASQVKAPVLLGAGSRDIVAPPEHTRIMRRALERAGVPVEAVIYDGEAHGNFLPDNRLDWANRVLSHLDRHIGTGWRPAAGS